MNRRAGMSSAPSAEPAGDVVLGKIGSTPREMLPVSRPAAVSDPSALDRILMQSPDNAGAWNNLGVSYRVRGQPEVALACYYRALASVPGFPAALGNLGNILKDLGHHMEALDAHRRTLDHHPNDARAWHNLGIAFNDMGRADEAAHAFTRTLEIDPSLEPVRFDRAIAYLRLGDYARGWEDFESRWSMPRAKRRRFNEPLWGGENLHGKRILVHCEQGFGDNILVTRFLPELKAMGATVYFECRPELVRWFAAIDVIDQLVLEGEALPAFDYHCPSMSLPKLFGATHHAVPPPNRIEPPAASKAKAVQLLPEDSRVFRIGIVWSGSVTFEGNRLRAAELTDFLSLYEIPGIQLYSLQKAEPRQALAALGSAALVTDLADYLTDFADTAAVVDRLDLIIMTDSAVAHVAGTLGRPIWNLLQEVPYWLYGLAGEETPWYPSMRLLRRRQAGDWAPVFRDAVSRLRALMYARHSG